MAGNSIGVVFKVTTWGESHGKATGVVIDGCPPGIDLNESDIQRDMDRRRPGIGESSSPREERDRVEIVSGTFEGKTTGTPLSLIIENEDVKSRDYDAIKDVFRPGHGDFTYHKKYEIRDYRGGGRASGRETAVRVAAGAVAKKIIHAEGISVVAYTREVGGISVKKIVLSHISENRLCCPDMDTSAEMEERLNEAKRKGDSLGGIVEILVSGCPPGLGEPVFDKIDADLAKALMSIGTVKGVEIGAGFQSAGMSGSECNDPITTEGFLMNNAGGVLAGITNGDDIVIRIACKPIASIEKKQQTIDIQKRLQVVSVMGRHDVSVIPRIIPVCEAMVSIVLADHIMRQRAIR